MLYTPCLVRFYMTYSNLVKTKFGPHWGPRTDPVSPLPYPYLILLYVTPFIKFYVSPGSEEEGINYQTKVPLPPVRQCILVEG